VIFTSDPRERLRHRPASDRTGGRLRLGTTAGFKSESPAGFVGIRNLKTFQALSYERLQAALSDLFGLTLSQGGLMNLLRRAQARFRLGCEEAVSTLR
jgi:hypothetical protein